MPSWGEFGFLLEDVAVLTLLTLFGDTHVIGVPLEGKDKKKLDFPNKHCPIRGTLLIKPPICLGSKISRKTKARRANFR